MQQQPESLQRQLGIAAALQINVAGDNPVAGGFGKAQRGGPGAGGPQHFEGGIGGHQLHDRRGVEGLAGIHSHQGAATSSGFLDHDTDAAERYAGAFQCLHYGGRNGLGRLGADRHYAEAEGE